MTARTDQFTLEMVCEATWRVLREVQCDRQCIPASAILMKTLHRTGNVDAYPLSVRAHIYNEAAMKYINQHRDYPMETNPELEALGAIVSRVGNNPGEVWAGHMGIVVPNHYGDRHAFIDMTISQGNVPERGIVLGVILISVPDGFVKGLESRDVKANGCLVSYDAYPIDRNYDNGKNWMQMPGLERCVEKVFQKLP